MKINIVESESCLLNKKLIQHYITIILINIVEVEFLGLQACWTQLVEGFFMGPPQSPFMFSASTHGCYITENTSFQ